MIFRSRRATATAALLLATGLGAAACSSAAAASPGALSPGAGQSALAGMPGSTATGPAGGAGGSAMPGMSMGASAAASGPAAAPVAGNAVAIKNFAFAPQSLTVKVGTTVTWTNEDTDAHTVTTQGSSSGPLNSPALSTGQSYTYTFTKAGTYSYMCTIHPFMTATVTVTQ